MKSRRPKWCPECDTRLSKKNIDNENYMVCPKCDYKEKFKMKQRVKYIKGLENAKGSH